jgi:hypothetical protein
VTDTPIGPIRFVGVCIPWRDAHVRTGRRDRAPCEDHLRFLEQARIVQFEASPLLEVGRRTIDERPVSIDDIDDGSIDQCHTVADSADAGGASAIPKL